MPRLEGAIEEVDGGEAELNDLASRLEASHISQTDQNRPHPPPQINYSHTEKRGPAYGSWDYLDNDDEPLPYIVQMPSPNCGLCILNVGALSASRGQYILCVITQLPQLGKVCYLASASWSLVAWPTDRSFHRGGLKGSMMPLNRGLSPLVSLNPKSLCWAAQGNHG